MSYTKKYINAIYDSRRKDLIEKIENDLIPHNIPMLPIDKITVDAAIKIVRFEPFEVFNLSEEVQNSQKFIEAFIELLQQLTYRKANKNSDIFNVIMNSFILDRIINSADSLKSEDIKLFIRLNF
jgi:hypothetical protein